MPDPKPEYENMFTGTGGTGFTAGKKVPNKAPVVTPNTIGREFARQTYKRENPQNFAPDDDK